MEFLIKNGGFNVPTHLYSEHLEGNRNIINNILSRKESVELAEAYKTLREKFETEVIALLETEDPHAFRSKSEDIKLRLNEELQCLNENLKGKNFTAIFKNLSAKIKNYLVTNIQDLEGFESLGKTLAVCSANGLDELLKIIEASPGEYGHLPASIVFLRENSGFQNFDANAEDIDLSDLGALVALKWLQIEERERYTKFLYQLNEIYQESFLIEAAIINQRHSLDDAYEHQKNLLDEKFVKYVLMRKKLEQIHLEALEKLPENHSLVLALSNELFHLSYQANAHFLNGK